MTVRSRLTLVYATAMVMTLALAGGGVWLQLRSALRASLADALQTRAATALTAIENQGQVGIQESDATTPPGVFVVIFDSDGQVVDATAGAPPGVTALPVGTDEVALAANTYAIVSVAGDNGVRAVAGSNLDSLNATLDRLESKRLVTSTRSVGTASRRLFAVTVAGARALAETRQLRDRLWRGVDLGELLA